MRCQQQTFLNPAAHFTGSLVGECDRNNFFRRIHRRQQTQIALGQKFGLACPGGRFHDERIKLQCPLTILFIVL